MSFSTDYLYSEAGDKINEDIGRVHQNLAWVIDGASGLSSRQFTPGPTDARWFVEQLDQALLSSVDNITPLTESLKQAVTRVSEMFNRLVPGEEFYPYEYPSCSIALIRSGQHQIDYLVLGDITLVIKTKDEKSMIITDSTVGQLDKKVAAKINAIQKSEKVTFLEARQHVSALLRQNRSLMNKPDGYWILGLDPSVIDHALTGPVRIKGPAQILLATDGFTRLLDTLQLFDDWDQLLTFIEEEGFEIAFKRLREVESGDAECLRYPRLKVSDDATGIYLIKN